MKKKITKQDILVLTKYREGVFFGSQSNKEDGKFGVSIIHALTKYK